MTAYYNEIDPYAAQWLRNLIVAGEIAPGVVDERSIEDVRPDDLKGFTQCHFFAGIGGWSIALRQAGWADNRPVWTGSCPCQPFSAAGAGKAADDKRHLWPSWFSLIAQRKPAIVFGEQVEAAIGWGWLDAVFSDLEKEGYACGASVLPACGVGAPHIRNRLWFVAHADNERHARAADRPWPAGGGVLAEPGSQSDLADAESGGQREQRHAPQPGSGGHPDGGFWSGAEWIACTDGKSRPVEPGSFPLAHGVQRRPSKLRAYGNAIVPQIAAEFIAAYGEALIAIQS